MQEQAKLDVGRRSQEQIQERMRWTFPERRAAITQDQVPIADLMVTYPLLFNEDEVNKSKNHAIVIIFLRIIVVYHTVIIMQILLSFELEGHVTSHE